MHIPVLNSFNHTKTGSVASILQAGFFATHRGNFRTRATHNVVLVTHHNMLEVVFMACHADTKRMHVKYAVDCRTEIFIRRMSCILNISKYPSRYGIDRTYDRKGDIKLWIQFNQRKYV